ncbi:MAG: rhodanese-like domain-containing protein [Gammaproteobacteria bacterium]
MPLMNPEMPGLRLVSEETLSRADATRLLADGGQLLAVRSPEESGRDLMPGALNLPVDALCYEYRRLNKRRPVILYCTTHTQCGRIASLLAGEGFSDIYHLSRH